MSVRFSWDRHNISILVLGPPCTPCPLSQCSLYPEVNQVERAHRRQALHDSELASHCHLASHQTNKHIAARVLFEDIARSSVCPFCLRCYDFQERRPRFWKTTSYNSAAVFACILVIDSVILGR